jgi:hypothetical protein
VEPVVDLGEVAGQEPPVSGDRVPAQGNGAGLGQLLAQELEDGHAGLLHRERRRLDRDPQAAVGVHLHHHRVHGVERLHGGVDDQVWPLGDDGQVVVGDQDGDLQDDVTVCVEAGHLQVDPGQHGPIVGWRAHAPGSDRPPRP